MLTPITLEKIRDFFGPGLKLVNFKKFKENFSNFVGPLPWRIWTCLSPAVEADLESLPSFIPQLNISWVKLSGDPNPALAIQFLRGINGVSALTISGCSYGNEFYDQLSSVPCIKCLEINSDSQMSAVVSYEFICSIRFLREICINDCVLALEDLGDAIKRSEVGTFKLYQNWMIQWKRLSFKTDQSDKPFMVSYRLSRSYFESWKEAVAFVRKCEQVNRQLKLDEEGRVIGPFIEAPEA